MTTSKTTPSGSTGTKLTKEQYDILIKHLSELGGSFSDLAKQKFGVDTSVYEHYYGYNKPID